VREATKLKIDKTQEVSQAQKKYFKINFFKNNFFFNLNFDNIK